jgi:hypothetical protein
MLDAIRGDESMIMSTAKRIGANRFAVAAVFREMAGDHGMLRALEIFLATGDDELWLASQNVSTDQVWIDFEAGADLLEATIEERRRTNDLR